MPIHLGIDIGAISVNAIAIGDEDDRERFEERAAQHGAFFCSTGDRASLLAGRPLLVSKYRRTRGAPVEALSDLLSELMACLPEDAVESVGLTGSGGKRIGELLDIPVQNEFQAVTRGVGGLHPDVRTIFEMGGDTSKYIAIDVDRSSGVINITDYERNGECAAGTGSFMDQQASRLLYDVEQIGDIVLTAERTATIAGRCSVFAKSDMIHAQQRGYQPPEVLKGLCEAVIRNFKGTITKGKKIVPAVAFIGGVAANKGAVQAMRNLFELDEEQLFVPELYAWMGAIGAALLSASSRGNGRVELRDAVDRLRDSKIAQTDFPRAEPLSTEKVILLRDRVKPYTFEDKSLPVDVYLGVDIGSVSTNLAVIDESGNLIYDIYTKTEARPIEVVGRGLEEIEGKIGDKIRIRGVGTTGSGRELIGELIGSDTINDEITAHKTGAMHVGTTLIDRKPDTIFEIGGQDSKFIAIDEGVVVDFAMNEACAAGTGSFLEEQAEKLGINIIGEFAELALSSDSPIRLGERCTVFMEKDLTPYLQRGARREDLIAGLSYSIVINYLNRVVRDRRIGSAIYFQGGTAYNDSAAAAFATILDKEIVVPPHNGVIGAIGAALLSRDKVKATERDTSFRGYDLSAIDYTLREFTCRACSNFCQIQEFRVEGERTYWGDKCSDRFRKRAKTDKKPVIPDMMALRKKFLMEGYDGEAGRGPKVGVARSMYFFDRFPFWNAYLSGIGCDVVLSDETNQKIVHAGLDAIVAEPCFPVTVAHGHVVDLAEKGVDFIFQPNVLNGETQFHHTQSFLCPWGQTLPFVFTHAPMLEAYADKLLKPTVHFRDGIEAVKGELRAFAKTLNVSRRISDRAVDAAYEAQNRFLESLHAAGQDVMEKLDETGENAVVVLGRPYNINDGRINLNVPSKLRDYYGVNVIPMDFLAMDHVDIRDINPNMYWNYGRKILQIARIVSERPNLHIIYITNFKCGPDSYIKHYTRDASGKPHLNLQFDAHSNDAGIMTRCEAYLDSKGLLR